MSSSMPIELSLVGFVGSIFWLACGLMLHDYWILVPNTVGVVIGVFSIYLIHKFSTFFGDCCAATGSACMSLLKPVGAFCEIGRCVSKKSDREDKVKGVWLAGGRAEAGSTIVVSKNGSVVGKRRNAGKKSGGRNSAGKGGRLSEKNRLPSIQETEEEHLLSSDGETSYGASEAETVFTDISLGSSSSNETESTKASESLPNYEYAAESISPSVSASKGGVSPKDIEDGSPEAIARKSGGSESFDPEWAGTGES